MNGAHTAHGVPARATHWVIHWAVVVIGAVLVVVLGGCADTPPPAAPPDVAAVDTDYARTMVGHHEQALALAALVPGRSSSPDVADLAFRIDRAQVEEVGQLQGFLRARGAPADPGPAMAVMDGMAATATLDRLRTLFGPAFDRLWLQTMTTHHEGALAMARRHLAATGGAASASALAEFSRTLLVAQQAEIDRMRGLLARG
ncbi:DUF305 domain-containing protein [Actinomycetospora sp. TBRC 11914]|uniref:DUF305 domain-containing protein n=1 Tax=Actinomycetospora sp. TBRC 11914 TaxID=2729387 RepID=UPI00145E341F|nr:DUF305 domain-containing protein [Actinomycetospora sp. TBRC 11914]NMO92886.1 DUF305 domain-containing protein [Actinomycetospora sp. TBRC 11914]